MEGHRRQAMQLVTIADGVVLVAKPPKVNDPEIWITRV
jgi:hypothetical protein